GPVVVALGDAPRVVLSFKEEPLFLVGGRTGAGPGADEQPAAAELFAGEDDGEPAVFDRFGGIAFENFIQAAIPQHDGAGTVVALRNVALEIPIVERMVLDADREVFVARLFRKPFRNRPRGEGAFDFEPEIIMEAAGAMFLNDKPPLCGCPVRASGFGGS